MIFFLLKENLFIIQPFGTNYWLHKMNHNSKINKQSFSWVGHKFEHKSDFVSNESSETSLVWFSLAWDVFFCKLKFFWDSLKFVRF